MPDRKGPTLMNLIRRKIALKTRIITDMWRGYNAISRLLRGGKLLYKHAIPVIHTQNIERLWRLEKRKIQNGTHRHHLRGYIDEFLFRRSANINNISVFDAILNGISTFCLLSNFFAFF